MDGWIDGCPFRFPFKPGFNLPEVIAYSNEK